MHYTSEKPVILFLLVFLSACINSPDVPLPDNVSVQEPEADVPKQYTQFLGKWGPAKWDDKLPHILIVEEVNSRGDAMTIYAYGSYYGWDVRPSWGRYWGTIRGNELRLAPFHNGANVKYKLRPDGTLRGTYTKNGRIYLVELHKNSK